MFRQNYTYPHKYFLSIGSFLSHNVQTKHGKVFNGVKITWFIKVTKNMSLGDKFVLRGGAKGVVTFLSHNVQTKLTCYRFSIFHI